MNCIREWGKRSLVSEVDSQDMGKVWLMSGGYLMQAIDLLDPDDSLSEFARCAIENKQLARELEITKKELANLREVIVDEQELAEIEANLGANPVTPGDSFNIGENDVDDDDHAWWANNSGSGSREAGSPY